MIERDELACDASPHVSGQFGVGSILLLRDGQQLSIEPFELGAGQLYIVAGRSATPVTEFLYAISGLQMSLQQKLRPINSGVGAAAPNLVDELSGKVFLDGRDLYTLPSEKRAQCVGTIFENPELSFLCNSVADDFVFSFYACGLKPPPIYHLRDYGLFDNRSQTPETLSGGEQQRLGFAAIVERSPRLVVADLSCSNLDKNFLEDLLLPWIKSALNRGTTFVLRGIDSHIIELCSGVLLVDSHSMKLVSTENAKLHANDARIQSISAAFQPRSVEPANEILLAKDALTPYSKVPVSLKLTQSEICILIGPNGSGKTSFAKAVIGNLPIVSGELILGKNVVPAIAFQNPEHCLFASKVEREIENPDALSLCNIRKNAWSRQPLELSRSKQKLVSIVAACEISDGLVILDEPTVGMDTNDQIQLQAILGFYADRSFLILTHDDALIGLREKPGVTVIDLGRRLA